MRRVVLLFWLSCVASALTAASGFRLFSFPGSHLHMTLAVGGSLFWLFACVRGIRRLKQKTGLITLHIYFAAILVGVGTRFFGWHAHLHHGLVYLLLVAQIHVTVRATLRWIKSLYPEEE